ncbi:helix-turn-helix domain-containing protein [Alicyclobacillus acidocaldarius]|uniref:helix-turn-helix domain-containing protein n=1 Tax=Alicyclobacillus acidocaldarius TaxID=405212 RepID=UPI0009D9E1B2|nr:helix-turn-helix domain-containing protein [Alicyclobacillus acidocaldarius]
MHLSNFAQRLKWLRERRGWTQEELAQALGVSRATIAGYESESKGRIPREEILIKIATIFDCTIDFLLGRTEAPHLFASKDEFPLDSEETQLITTIQKLSSEQRKQVQRFADYLLSIQESDDQHSRTDSETKSQSLNITELAAHMENEYGVIDPNFAIGIRKVIEEVLKEYDITKKSNR